MHCAVSCRRLRVCIALSFIRLHVLCCTLHKSLSVHCSVFCIRLSGCTALSYLRPFSCVHCTLSSIRTPVCTSTCLAEAPLPVCTVLFVLHMYALFFSSCISPPPPPPPCVHYTLFCKRPRDCTARYLA